MGWSADAAFMRASEDALLVFGHEPSGPVLARLAPADGLVPVPGLTVDDLRRWQTIQVVSGSVWGDDSERLTRLDLATGVIRRGRQLSEEEYVVGATGDGWLTKEFSDGAPLRRTHTDGRVTPYAVTGSTTRRPTRPESS